jgi:hypothetical protein
MHADPSRSQSYAHTQKGIGKADEKNEKDKENRDEDKRTVKILLKKKERCVPSRKKNMGVGVVTLK